MDNTRLELKGIYKNFGNVVALKNISMTTNSGQINCILGDNGAGKSTLVNIISGVFKQSKGQYKINGETVSFLNPLDAINAGISTVYQSLAIIPILSIYRNFFLGQEPIKNNIFKTFDKDFATTTTTQQLKKFDINIEDPKRVAGTLSGGERQILAISRALYFGAKILILDEPTSGVDPVARDDFWQLLIGLARQDGVTIFISTHFMNEAARCDRISLMHAGKVLATDTPEAIKANKSSHSLEEAFIAYLVDAQSTQDKLNDTASDPAAFTAQSTSSKHTKSLRRLLSYTSRETLELIRDPIRLTMSILGSMVLMVVIGYGITMDVEDLRYAVFDRDQSATSIEYRSALSGSRYFNEQPAIVSYSDMDKRMKSGEISLAVEIPPEFGQKVHKGEQVQLGAWIDGSMPSRAETIQGYVTGIHMTWLLQQASQMSQVQSTSDVNVVSRYLYNPDIRSLVAIVPAVMPMLLLMIPALLTSLAVVREKELGSIINLYVTPVTKLEFLLGKQLPYIVTSFVSFLLLVAMAVWLFNVPLKGDIVALCVIALLFVTFSTSFGLLASVFTNSQIAAILLTTIGTMVPAVQFAGMITPVSALEGAGRVIGEVHPVSYFLLVSRGIFSKGLDFSSLDFAIIPIALSIPITLWLSTVLLKKQER